MVNDFLTFVTIYPITCDEMDDTFFVPHPREKLHFSLLTFAAPALLQARILPAD